MNWFLLNKKIEYMGAAARREKRMTTTQTCAQVFQQAHDEFVPAADDRPDNIPFYRRFFGAKALLAHLGASGEQVKSAWHNLHYACCNSTSGAAGGYAEFCASFKHSIGKLPERPKPVHQYHLRPTMDLERRARQIFVDEFQRTYPGKRINSKLANEKWKKCGVKAGEIAQKELDASVAEWDKKEERIKKENAAKISAWKADCDQIAWLQGLAELMTAEPGR